MATSGVSSHGTQLQVKDSGTFKTIGEVLDISGPGTTLNTEDATSHDSAGWREPLPTIREGGEVTFDVNYYGETEQKFLRTSQGSRTRLEFQMVLPTISETLGFSGYVTGFEYSAPVEGILRASITIAVTGAITPS